MYFAPLQIDALPYSPRRLIAFDVVFEPTLVVLETLFPLVLGDPLARKEAGFLGRLTLPHPLDDEDRAAVEEVRFAAAR